MTRYTAPKIAGPGFYVNALGSGVAKRRAQTELRAKIAAGTRIKQFTQGETLLASIETVLISPAIPSFVNTKGCASLVWVLSMTAANTLAVGTMTLLNLPKTLNRVVRLHLVAMGPMDPLRAGA
jgi:hypothetical protein